MASVSDLSRLITELFELVVAYIKNQTLVPLKRLLRYVGLGITGLIFIAIGLLLVSIGLLRYLETLSTFDGTWSFVPYLIVSLTAICIIGILFFVMTRSTLIKSRPSGEGKYHG